MTIKSREVAHMFLRLPTHTKVAILKVLGLHRPEEDNLPESERWILPFKRAKDEQRHGVLCTLIEE